MVLVLFVSDISSFFVHLRPFFQVNLQYFWFFNIFFRVISLWHHKQGWRSWMGRRGTLSLKFYNLFRLILCFFLPILLFEHLQDLAQSTSWGVASVDLCGLFFLHFTLKKMYLKFARGRTNFRLSDVARARARIALDATLIRGDLADALWTSWFLPDNFYLADSASFQGSRLPARNKPVPLRRLPIMPPHVGFQLRIWSIRVQID